MMTTEWTDPAAPSTLLPLAFAYIEPGGRGFVCLFGWVWPSGQAVSGVPGWPCAPLWARGPVSPGGGSRSTQHFFL